MVYCTHTAVKVTFEIPDEVATLFKQSVPAGERSAAIARFMASEARKRHARDVAACAKVNEILKKDRTLREWEQFDDSE
jgi:hypothetical protein